MPKISTRKAMYLILVLLLPLSSAFVTPMAERRILNKSPSSYRLNQEHPALTSLQASPLALLASSPLPSLTLLAGIILIHESGHYLAARLFGIKVEEFSIGVGPKLFGFTAFGDEFNLRALPLGGYVRFPENYNATKVRELERIAVDNAKAFDKSQEMDAKTIVINALTLGAVDDKRRKAAKERRDELKSENKNKKWWTSLGKRNEQEIPDLLDLDDVEIELYDDPDLLQNRPWFQRAVVLSGGVIFNLLLAWSIYFGTITAGPGLPRPIFDAGALVSVVPRVDSASNGLLQRGDVILSIDGRSVTASNRPSAADAEKGLSDLISTIRATRAGDSVKLNVLHPGSKAPVDVIVKPTRVSETAPSTIGVMLSPNFVKSEVMRTTDVFKASRLAADYTIGLTKATASGVISAFTGFLSGKSGAGPQVTGPIGLIRTGSEIVATKDWTSVLMFAAAISINLGVVNALPFPALDGGQLLFVLAEALTGRKVNQRVQEGITGAALLFLLLFSAGAAIGDIGSIFGM